MNIKNVIIILTYIYITNCINIEIVAYDSISLIYRTNIINNDGNIFFNFLIDTGSPYTWIPGVKREYHNHYNVTNLNKIPIDNNITVTYNSGDKINFSIYDINLYINNISISNAQVGITYYESKHFERVFDGILGLGGFYGNDKTIEYYKKKIITSQMVNQSIIKNNIFSLYINKTHKNFGDLNMNGGKINFGEIDKNKYNGNIKWYHIYNEKNIYYFWSLNLSNITINETLYINNRVLIDSGTNFIFFNNSICDKIHNQIGGIYNKNINSYIFENVKKLKNISIYLNNDEFILTPKDYTYILNNTIHSKISINDNNNVVLGLPFLQKYYSIYDFDNKKIGLAESNQ